MPGNNISQRGPGYRASRSTRATKNPGYAAMCRSAQRYVKLLQRRGAGDQFLLTELIERHVDRVEQSVEVVGIRPKIQEPGNDLVCCLALQEIIHRRGLVARVVILVQLAQ